MKIMLISMFFTIFLLSGCTTYTDPFQEAVLYSFQLDYYNTGTTCENNTEVAYINNYDMSKNYQTHTEYEESFFNDNSVIFISDIKGSSNSSITIESLFNYEETTHLFYSDYSALPSGQCYNFEIEVEGKLLNPEIEIHESSPEHFISTVSNNQITFFFLEETNYLIYQESNQYSISTFDFTYSENKMIIENFKTHLDKSNRIEIEFSNLEISFELNDETFELSE